MATYPTIRWFRSLNACICRPSVSSAACVSAINSVGCFKGISFAANRAMHHVSAASLGYTSVLHLARSSRHRTLRAFKACCLASAVDSTTSARKRVTANGLNFVVDDQGDTRAIPVILLHGFPNRANVWERQVYFAHLLILCIQQVRDVL